MEERTYEDGVRDGKIEALEQKVTKHTAKLDNHERILAALIGVLGFIQVVPELRVLING